MDNTRHPQKARPFLFILLLRLLTPSEFYFISFGRCLVCLFSLQARRSFLAAKLSNLYAGGSKFSVVGSVLADGSSDFAAG